MPIRNARRLLLAAVGSLLVGCSGATGGGAAAGPRPAAIRTDVAEADVQFIRHMIVHHRQALAMTDLARRNTDAEDIHLLAQRIDVSQQDELAMMRRWLEDRGLSVEAVAPSEHGAHGSELMPGMLTPEQMEALAGASGDEFDRLFLEGMIRHHQGALVMVEELFASDQGAQNAEMYQIASHIDSDQRIEIARMSRMLAARR